MNIILKGNISAKRVNDCLIWSDILGRKKEQWWWYLYYWSGLVYIVSHFGEKMLTWYLNYPKSMVNYFILIFFTGSTGWIRGYSFIQRWEGPSSFIFQPPSSILHPPYFILLAWACGVPAVGVRAVDCWQWRSGHYFHPSFLFFFPFFFPPFFSRFSPPVFFLLRRDLFS